MKRRKWWLVALSLALLAACVGVWKWSERPTYAFLEGATMVAQRAVTHGSSQSLVTIYSSDSDTKIIARAARKELPDSWDETDIPYTYDRMAVSFTSPDGEWDVAIDINEVTANSWIVVSQPLIWTDRINLWMPARGRSKLPDQLPGSVRQLIDDTP